MDTIKISKHDDRATLQLSRGRSNPINKAMCADLREAFDDLAGDDAVRGVVLRGSDGFFSAGLDVIELYDYDPSTMESFFEEFHSLLRDFVAFPKPIIAAITGHSPAGGCVLALPCDYRVMAEGKYRIGLNEVAVHIVPPASLYPLMAFWIGNGRAYDAMVNGKLFDVAEAKRIGLIDEFCPLENVVERASSKLDEMLKLDDRIWRDTKALLRAPLVSELDGDSKEPYAKTLENWWTEDSREAMAGFVKSLKKN